MKTEVAPAPTPDLADAAIVRRIDTWDVRIILWGHEEGMRPEEIVRRLPALSLADVYAVIAYALRHPEEMEDYLRSLKAIGERVGVNVDAIRPDRRERMARGSARRAATQREGLDGDAQDESQAVASARRRVTAYRRRRPWARHRRCLRCSSARAGTGGWMGRVKSRLCKVVFCFNALVATVHAFHSAAIYLECIRSQISILLEAFMQVIGAA